MEFFDWNFQWVGQGTGYQGADEAQEKGGRA